MAKNVKINFSFGKLRKRLDKIVANTIDDIARIQVDGIRLGFISGTDIKDRKYEPSIVNRRPIRLVKSGRMRDGVHVSTFTNPTAAVKSATITSGSRSRDYAAVHNEGLGDMPKREWFPTKKILKRTQGDVTARLRSAERKIVRSVK